MQYGIDRKCESIIGMFDGSVVPNSAFPIEYDSPTFSYSHSKKSSLGTKLYAITSNLSGTDYTANDYVKTNLIALYDAKENIGYGQHSNSTTAWKNLVNASSDWDLTVNSTATSWWDDDCVNIPGTGEFAHSEYNMVDGITVECCFELHDISDGESYADGYCPFMIGNASSAWSSNRRRIIVYPREGGMYVNTYQKWLSATTAESKFSYWVDSNASGMKTVCTYMASCDFTPENQSFYVNSADFSTAYCSSGESFPEHPWSFNGQVVRIGINAFSDTSVPSLPFKGKLYSIRIYSGNVAKSDVKTNFSIDRARYGS